MAAPDQKSPNVLLQSLCCRLTGKSEAEVAHQFQYAVRVIGSNYAPTIERDEFLVSEKIKKELLKQRREADAALFSELHRKLQTQGVLKHRWSVLYLLLSLCEDPRKPSTRTTATAAKTAKKTPWCAWTREMEERLVELWRERPCLFDVSHELFHNRMEKDKSWLEMAVALQLPVEEVHVKAKKLRALYSRMLKPKPASASGSQRLTSRQKWLVRDMDFIKQHIVHRAPKTTLEVQTLEQDDETEDEDTRDSEPSSESPSVPDHISNFGNLAAQELRQIKDPITLIRLKRSIYDMIYDAQSAEMNGTSSSSSPPAPYSGFNPAILPPPPPQSQEPQCTFHQDSSLPQGPQSHPQYMSHLGSHSQSYLQSLQNSDPSESL